MLYHNYHRHSHKGNFRALDSVVKNQDYIKRAIELGHKIVFSTEHGCQGDTFELKFLIDNINKELPKENQLKMGVGCEFYYVEDRHINDRSNRHLVVIALNDNGWKQINLACSIANDDGFYYKPRIDREILFNVFKPNDVIVTTACVGGVINAENYEELIKDMKEYFGKNLFLEVQSHLIPSQKETNKKVLELSKKLNIDIIHGNDSHYIYPNEKEFRTRFLIAKEILKPSNDDVEEQCILDYPSSDMIYERYREQGILTDEEVTRALQNTLVFDKCELTLINYEIKLPSISKNSEEEFDNIIDREWDKYKTYINEEDFEKYNEAIQLEKDIVHKTKMEDYFILDHKIVEKAKNEYGGILTPTGRGSGVSFFINKMLKLTDIDRLKSPVELYPTRFMSPTRILKTKSLPDLDMNLVDDIPFIKATEDLLGKENCAWLISYKLLQDSSAFRMWCKSLGMKIAEYDVVAKNLDKFKNHKKWGKLIQDSKVFIGVVESISPSPCSMVLYDKSIAEEIGLVKTEKRMCCMLDGLYCDKFKYLKNDYLSVTTVKILKNVCDLIGIKIPNINELTNLLDEKTFEIYSKGLTCTINQVDSDFATNLVKQYKPKSVSELCAFIAAIRPGFKSLLNNFIARKDYSTGEAELDSLLTETNHYLLYQESIMKCLIWLGIKEEETYGIIKKISKKVFTDEELHELKNTLKENWQKRVGNVDNFEKVWAVIEDASRYSFNASHSLSYAYDSLYGAYLKSHYPLEYYSIVLNQYNDDLTRTAKLMAELNYFGIKVRNAKFRYSKAEYFFDRDINTIYKGLESIKYINKTSSDYLYSLRENKYDTFVDLLVDLKKELDSKKITLLISIGFFSEFGTEPKLLKIFNLFNTMGGRSTLNKIKDIDFYIEYKDIILNHATKDTAKQIRANMIDVVRDIELNMEEENPNIKDILEKQKEFIGSVSITEIEDKVYEVGSISFKEADCRACLVENMYSWNGEKVISLYCLKSQSREKFYMKNNEYKENPFSIYDIIYLKKIEKKEVFTFYGDLHKKVPTGEYKNYIREYDIKIKY